MPASRPPVPSSGGLWALSVQAAWLFPGLGCRYVGMGNDLFGRTGAAARLIAAAEDYLGYRLQPICLEGSGRKVVPARQEAQVIYAINCAYAASLAEEGNRPMAVLGHSLGAWAAAWAAGVYDFITGLELVTEVERLLEEVADHRELTMGAIIGLGELAVQGEIASYPQVTIANFNSPAQYVIAGPVADVENVLAAATSRGAKQARLLPTRRAVHTPWMEEVAVRLKPRLDLVTWCDPEIPFIACDCGKELGRGSEICDFFSVFLTRPVRWETSFRTLCSAYTSRFLEVGPGALLTTLASFIDSKAIVRTATEHLDQVP